MDGPGGGPAEGSPVEGGPAEGGRGYAEGEGHISPPPLSIAPSLSPLPPPASGSPHPGHRTPHTARRTPHIAHRTPQAASRKPHSRSGPCKDQRAPALHHILQCICSHLIETKLAATSAATSYSAAVFQPSAVPKSSAAAPQPAADPTPESSASAAASTNPAAAAAVPKAVAEAVAATVAKPPPVTALGPDTGAAVLSKAADEKCDDWYKVGSLQDWQARQAPAFQRNWSLGAEVLSLHLLPSGPPPEIVLLVVRRMKRSSLSTPRLAGSKSIRTTSTITPKRHRR